MLGFMRLPGSAVLRTGLVSLLMILSACGDGPAGDITAPSVSSVSPSNNATAVAINTALSVSFTEGVAADSVGTGNFTLSGPSGAVAGTVNVTGATATFTPSASLAYSSAYTASISGARDAAGNVMSGTHSWSFTTGVAPDTTAPQVSNTSPANNATGVAVNTAVNAGFSEAMNAASITATSFTLSSAGAAVAGNVSYSGTTATFTPAANLAYGTVYTATITTAAQDLAGNALAGSYSWAFTTGPAPDTTAPTVSSVTPSSSATGVLVNTSLSATFSEAMNPATVSTASFTLAKQGVLGSTPVTGTVGYSGTTATFTPSASLEYDSTYVATLTVDNQDLAGNALAGNHSWQFTTGPAPDTIPPQVSGSNPANNAINVAVNSAISASFSEALDPATVTTATLSLSGPAGAVAGTVNYSGTTASFTPSASLAYSTAYTFSVAGGASGVKDLAGNALAASYSASFTTGPAPDTTPPTVSSTTPADAASNVSVGSTITVNFSEAVDAATVSTSTLVLKDAGNNTVAGSVGLAGTTATFTPGASLAYSTAYTLSVVSGANGVKDLAGNALAADFAISFTTAAAPDTTPPTVSSTTPASGATGVEPNSSVTASFSETMNGSTLTTGSFTLTGPSGAVAGSVGYSGLAASLAPASALDTNTSYTATVTTAAQDVAGNGLASNHSWNFTTRPFTRQLGSAMIETGYGVATDASGNVYVAGTTTGALDGQTSAGGQDLFVVKYDSKGLKQWTRQMGTAGNDFGYGVAADASGNVYVAGTTNGALDGQASAGGNDFFVVKYDANGVKQWTRQLGTAWDEFGYGVAADASGNVYVAGTVNAGGLDGQTSAGGFDLFVVKYDANGVKQWTRQLGTATSDVGYGVAADASGNVYVTGATSGALDGQALAGSYDIYVVKYDANGVKQWTRQLGTPGFEVGRGVAADANGNVYVTGETGGALDGQALAGSYDVYVVKYDTNGVKQWTRQFGTAIFDIGYGAAADAAGNVYVTGHTTGDALDGQAPSGSYDLFVVKYDANGVKQWTRLLGTTGAEIGRGAATDANGNVYVTGETAGPLDGQAYAGGADVFVVKYDSNGNKK